MRLQRVLRISGTTWYRRPIHLCRGWLKLLWILPFIPIALMVTLNTKTHCELSERFGASKDELTRLVQYNYTLHPDERAFPLAFSIVVYRDLDRALRLLHAIHRPHNCYCIHMDRRTTGRFREILELEVRKRYTSEVFVVPEEYSFTVRWGTMSVLDADLICSRILLARCPDWAYWINLTGQEFPLRTNWELVTALKLLNGSNVIDGTFKNRMYSRFPLYYRLNFSVSITNRSPHVFYFSNLFMIYRPQIE
ncbi:Beta-1 3-galactosyl-O-glycosyl-glycoprotein beta-1 6-N-acetylglucosaminyltransferase 3 [Paragonimus heterotremus]|uniref:Beta-1 3-galactosyl-O-glycosyl-glycoprotein beta-1 6-N-acetylglucosaminyltransferase 3 n=1 Tax=Paragonimus heterotremus TaxID=100268 RepID=A0A8J4T142_9TREM|nr:Beta-1 3-galactosyl-O-glycosyl-glycoprotein beta-1 6-N-acetylglucosaminyltransferase 3 [Paragonimus heterotremus]